MIAIWELYLCRSMRKSEKLGLVHTQPQEYLHLTNWKWTQFRGVRGHASLRFAPMSWTSVSGPSACVVCKLVTIFNSLYHKLHLLFTASLVETKHYDCSSVTAVPIFVMSFSLQNTWQRFAKLQLLATLSHCSCWSLWHFSLCSFVMYIGSLSLVSLF